MNAVGRAVPDAARFNDKAELPYGLRKADFELAMQDIYDLLFDIDSALLSRGVKRLNLGWTDGRVAEALERDAHTIGACRTYLHRLGFVLKRPKKRLLKADAAKRRAFARAYAALRREAEATSAQVFFVDEAHCYADVDLHAKWVLKGEPALVDSTGPRWGEKASSYSAVCLETGEVAA